jgi:hypothetical protein
VACGGGGCLCMLSLTWPDPVLLLPLLLWPT